MPVHEDLDILFFAEHLKPQRILTGVPGTYLEGTWDDQGLAKSPEVLTESSWTLTGQSVLPIKRWPRQRTNFTWCKAPSSLSLVVGHLCPLTSSSV